MTDPKINTDQYRGTTPATGAITGTAVGLGTVLGISALLGKWSKSPMGKTSTAIGYALSAAFTAFSTYIGYKNAKNGQDQFEALALENAELLATQQNIALAALTPVAMNRASKLDALQTRELAASPVSVEEPVIKTPTIVPAPTTKSFASELAETPVSIEEPPIKEPVIKTPTIAPAPTTKSFAETAPAPTSAQGGHAAAIDASQQETSQGHTLH